MQNGSLGTVTEVDVKNGILTVKLDQGKLVMAGQEILTPQARLRANNP